MAWQIVKHAFLMIFNNFEQAIRVSLVPVILLLVAFGVWLGAAGIPLSALSGTADPAVFTGIGVQSFLLLVVVLVVFLFVAGWIAVSWHRFILLEEYTSVVPATTGRPILGYVGKSFLLGIIVVLGAIPVMFIVVFLFDGAFTATAHMPVVSTILPGFLAGSIMGFLWFRMAICLPAKAVNEEMSFGQAWAATSRMSGTVFGITMIIVTMNLVAGLVPWIVFSGLPILSVAFEIAINWLSTMVGISVLTTLYGHLVEGRPLID